MQNLWCWRCRATVAMLEPSEWAVLIRARDAGARCTSVLDEAKAGLRGHDYTPLPARASVLTRRFAYLVQGYELFTGVHENGWRRIPHHRTELYGPPCTDCGKPLRSPSAQVCVACGKPRSGAPVGVLHNPSCQTKRVRLHVPNLASMSISDILAGPLPYEEFEDPLLAALADPELGLVNHEGLLQLANPETIPPVEARMVQGLFLFHSAVLGDDLRRLPSRAGWQRAARGGSVV